MTPQEWLLSERNYTTGRQLYDVLGDNQVLKRTLATGASKYNVEALAWELQKLAKVRPRVGHTLATPESIGHVLVTSRPERGQDVASEVHEELETTRAELESTRQELDETQDELDQLEERQADEQHVDALLQQLQQERGPLYDQRTYLHAQLEHVDEPTRLQYAQRIQALSRQIDATWRAAAHVQEHGQLPDPAPAAPAFDIQGASLSTLLSHRANVRSNISKLKKLLLRADDLAAATAECELLTARIDELKGKEGARG